MKGTCQDSLGEPGAGDRPGRGDVKLHIDRHLLPTSNSSITTLIKTPQLPAAGLTSRPGCAGSARSTAYRQYRAVSGTPKSTTSELQSSQKLSAFRSVQPNIFSMQLLSSELQPGQKLNASSRRQPNSRSMLRGPRRKCGTPVSG